MNITDIDLELAGTNLTHLKNYLIPLSVNNNLKNKSLTVADMPGFGTVPLKSIMN